MEQQRRKQVKAYGTARSRSGSFDLREEEPILDHQAGAAAAAASGGSEVVVKIDGNSHNPFATDPDGASQAGKVWREGSYDFWKEGQLNSSPKTNHNRTASPNAFSFKNRPPSSLAPASQLPPVTESASGGGVGGGAAADDPPSRLISSFLRKQAASGGEVALDLDIEMEELKQPPPSRIPTSTYASKELRVSFQNSGSCSTSSSSSSGSDADAEVIRCTSNSSFRSGASSLLRAKTRSRLMDPPPPQPQAAASGDDERKSVPWGIPKSGQIRSGMLGKSGPFEEEEEDPFVDADIPNEFKRAKFDFLTIIQWVSLVLIVAALVCSLTIRRLARQTLWGLHLWKWELLVLVLICGRLVSGWVIRVAVFFVERNFLLRKRVLYFVYGVRRAVQNALWLGLALASWHFMFDKNVERQTRSSVLPYVTKVLFCLLVATLIRLVKTLLVKVLASSFHVSTYFDRIQEALFNQYVIETLSAPPLVDVDRMMAEMHELQRAGATIPSELRSAAMPSKASAALLPRKSIRLSGAVSRREFSRQMMRDKGDDSITIDQLHKLNPKNISAWNMKRLIRIVRYGTLMTMDEQIQQATGEEDESAMQIHSEYEAKVAAKRIFNNVAKPGSKYIYLSDLMRFMRQEEAVKAMNLFEGAQEHNRVSKKSLKNWVVNAFRERKALALTLNDTKTAVNKLHQMANVVVGVIVFVLWLLILGIATTHFFVFLSSQVLVAVFMFGNTMKTIFEAIVFLFVMHPFDVGDRCEVEGVQLIVEEMNIMTTIFLRYDNLKIYYPNSELATKPIMNFYRSPDMGDAIDFTVHVATPVEKLAMMKERIIQYIENKKEHWYPGPMVVLRDVDDSNKLKVSIWLRHRINYQDMGLRFERRELVLQEMIKVLKELEIEYRLLPLDVNVRNMPPVNSSRMPSTWSTYN